MFESSWSVKLGQKAQHITVASLPQPSLIWQGQSNQLAVYCNNNNQVLPIRKQVLALNSIDKQLVLILTRYSLSCFDLLNNEEKFNLQFENAQKMYILNRMIYVVSRSSLYCYDCNGEEQYVNHVSGNITAITNTEDIVKADEIVIATDAATMMRYSKLNIIFDYAKIIGNATALCWIGKGVIIGTEEGSIAYYETKKYKWKAKSSHSLLTILKFQQISQYNKNAQFQSKKPDKIVVVRKNGNLQIRDWENGATLSKIKLGENIIHSFTADFRNEGFNQIICSLESGTIRALNLKDQTSKSNLENKTVNSVQAFQIQDSIQHLNKIKQQILFELSQLKKKYTQNTEQNIQGEQGAEILSSNFKMVASLEYKQGLILQIKCQNGYISGLSFEQAIMPIFVKQSDSMLYKFSNATQCFGDIVCQALVHSSFSNSKFEVRKIVVTLPKFWKWGLDPTIRHNIQGRLKFKLIQRNARFIMWIKQCFLVNISQKSQQKMESLSVMKFRFFNWYEQKQMEIIFLQQQGVIQINCDCLKTMGEIFQDLINFVGLKNLNSELLFPAQKQKIKEIIQTIQKLTQTKTSFTTDLADSINSIKFLLVKGESARLVGSMNNFRKTYGQIMQYNRNLVTEMQKKQTNTIVLMETLKRLNAFINQIANVRYGEPKNQLIAKCRQAIKNKKFPQIYSIMDKGVEAS